MAAVDSGLGDDVDRSVDGNFKFGFGFNIEISFGCGFPARPRADTKYRVDFAAGFDGTRGILRAGYERIQCIPSREGAVLGGKVPGSGADNSGQSADE